MNILFLGYWSVEDGLSEATIKPHLEILNSFDEVDQILYVSIERFSQNVTCSWSISKMNHLAYYSTNLPFLIDKVSDFTLLPFKLIKICRENKIDKIICRSSPAGAIGYLVSKKTKLPYYVESFEPHADYMVESGVWNKWGLRYNFQKYFEWKQRQTAAALMTVSNNYTSFLKLDKSTKCTIETIPCGVELDEFKFSAELRNKVKKELEIDSEAIVGVYVGKFGGIYYDDEIFRYFKNCFENIANFFLLILTPHDEQFMEARLSRYKIPYTKVWYGYVKHNKLSMFLSAADVAFCPVKTSNNRKFCSPTKNAEYWANGLPILISEGIGDDSEIIKFYGGGLIVDYVEYNQDRLFDEIRKTMIHYQLNRDKNQSVINAQTYRSHKSAKQVYHKLLFDEIPG